MTRARFNIIKSGLIIFSSSLAAQQSSLPVIEYGPIKANETLWSIAKKFAPEGKSVTRISESIFQRNPGAFNNNNINQLKKGAVLTIPRPDSVSRKRPEIEQQVITANPAVTDPAQNPVIPVVSEGGNSAMQPQTAYNPAKSLSDTDNSAIDPAVPDVTIATTNSGLNDDAESNRAPVVSSQKKTKVNTSFGYEVAIEYDDNIGRTKYSEDIRDDTILNFSLTGTRLMKTGRFSHLSLGASLDMEKYSDFQLLDNIQYALKLKYSFAFASGFLAPVYAVRLDLGGIESDSNIRASNTASVGLRMNRWLTDSMILALGYNYKLRDADSEVFDTSEHQIFANFDIELSRRSAVYLSFGYTTGDIVSSATPRPLIIDIADAIEADDAIGGSSGNLIAYRLDADSLVYTLGYNSVLTRFMSMDFSLRYIDSEASKNNDVYYDRSVFRAGVLGRF